VAWYLLRYAGGVRAGDDVLIMGAGGGLGIAGVLIAKALGARVIVAAGSSWKLDRCRELLGADHAVSYAEPGWADRVRSISSGVAVVYENISDPELFADALGTLRPYGRVA